MSNLNVIKTYLDLDGLQKYDAEVKKALKNRASKTEVEELKNAISEGVASDSIKVVDFEGVNIEYVSSSDDHTYVKHKSNTNPLLEFKDYNGPINIKNLAIDNYFNDQDINIIGTLNKDEINGEYIFSGFIWSYYWDYHFYHIGIHWYVNEETPLYIDLYEAPNYEGVKYLIDKSIHNAVPVKTSDNTTKNATILNENGAVSITTSKEAYQVKTSSDGAEFTVEAGMTSGNPMTVFKINPNGVFVNDKKISTGGNSPSDTGQITMITCDSIVPDLLKILSGETNSVSRSLTVDEIAVFRQFIFNDSLNAIYCQSSDYGIDSVFYKQISAIEGSTQAVLFETSYIGTPVAIAVGFPYPYDESNPSGIIGIGPLDVGSSSYDDTWIHSNFTEAFDRILNLENYDHGYTYDPSSNVLDIHYSSPSNPGGIKTKNALFSETDEGNPYIGNGQGTRSISIGIDNAYADADYRTYTFPDKDGTVALLSDIPTTPKYYMHTLTITSVSTGTACCVTFMVMSKSSATLTVSSLYGLYGSKAFAASGMYGTNIVNKLAFTSSTQARFVYGTGSTVVVAVNTISDTVIEVI